MDAPVPSASLAVRDVLSHESVHAAVAVVCGGCAGEPSTRPKGQCVLQAQEQLGEWIETSLDAYRDVRDHAFEVWFDAIYGSPLVQAMVGLKASDESVRRRPGTGAAHLALVAQRIEELRASISKGGPREAVLRALLYVRIPERLVDERSFNLLRRMREEAGRGLTLAAFKRLVREQFLMLLLDERSAVAAIPVMLARDPDLASRMTGHLRQVIDVVGLSSKVAKARFAEIEPLFERSVQLEAPRAHLGSARSERPHVARSPKHA